MSLRVPAPPSVNHTHRVGSRHGRPVVALSQGYRRWLRYTVPMMRAGLARIPPQTPARVEIVMAIGRRRDLDNIVKPLLDALESAGILPDDRYVDRIDARREGDQGDVAIAVEPL